MIETITIIALLSTAAVIWVYVLSFFNEIIAPELPPLSSIRVIR